MVSKRSMLRWLGVLTWACLGGGVYALARVGKEADGHRSIAHVQRYFLGAAERVEVKDPSHRLRLQDPVFFQSLDGSWQQVGFVESLSVDSAPTMIHWYAEDIEAHDCRLTLYRNRGRLEDVVTTMLPPEMRQKIQTRMKEVMRQHGEELSAAFVPLVQTSLQRSMPVIEEEFLLSVERHRPEIEDLGKRWNDEVVTERLIPLARREIVPILREHGEPTAEEIGKELWDRASIWRFGWRAVYDRSPLPRKDLLQEEWDRFVDEEAVPVFEAYMDEIVIAVQEILAAIAANETVRHELTDVANGIAADPETQKLVRQILQETLLENQRLRDVWTNVWSGRDAQAALDLAGDRLEPVIRQIGDDLFGSREEGINPNFARVLRNQILGKDRQWIVATVASEKGDADPVVKLAYSTESMPYPIVYLADQTGDDLSQSETELQQSRRPLTSGDER